MPLVKGKSKGAISANIAIERAAGKPENQAIAIAESEAGNSRKRIRRKPKMRYSEFSNMKHKDFEKLK